MSLPGHCQVIARSLPCHSHVVAMVIAMSLPCHHCHVIAMVFSWSLPCHCHVIAMSLPWYFVGHCHVIAMSLPCHCHDIAMSVPCHVIAMSVPCHCHVVAMSLPRCRSGHPHYLLPRVVCGLARFTPEWRAVVLPSRHGAKAIVGGLRHYMINTSATRHIFTDLKDATNPHRNWRQFFQVP